MKYLVILTVTLIGTLVLLDIVLGKDPIGNMVKHWSDEESAAIGLLVVVLLTIAVGITALGKRTSVFISINQMSGRTENGKQVSFPVDSVARVEFRHNRYAPGLIISSKQTERKIFMLTIGLDREKAYLELQASIGRNHVLTKWFEEDAA